MTPVTTCVKNREPQYDIVVRDKNTATETTFRTKRVLSNIGTDALRGRGTRVWEVIELDADGNEKDVDTCVLKDVWADDDCEREGDILAAIRRDAEGKSRYWLEQFDNYFLTTVTYGDVYVNGEPDKTRQWEMPKNVGMLNLKSGLKEPRHIASDLVGAITFEQPSEDPVVQYYSTKVHHRIVFKEMGTTILDIESLQSVFVYLGEAMNGEFVSIWPGSLNVLMRSPLALTVLHTLGWVHRDVSSGNILVVDDGVKLADLEYAKREGDTSLHGIRTVRYHARHRGT